MIIEIKGVQFINKGAELMLMAVLDQIERRWPNAEIALEPSANSPYIKRARLGAYQKWSVRWSRRDYMLDINQLTYTGLHAVQRWSWRKWGVVTERDVNVVFDASGFAYSDQWPAVKVRQLSAELLRYGRAGKPYIFLPQAFGPFTRVEDRRRLKSSLPFATLVAARDSESARHLGGLFDHVPNNLKQYPDFTNLLEGKVPEYFETPNRKIIIIPNSRMLDERNKDHAWRNTYVPLLRQAVRVVQELDCIPVILNHEGQSDAIICQDLIAQAGDAVEVISEDDPILIKGIIGAARAIICSRFHGCVSALSQGVPCLGTSWSHKYERLFDEYGRSDFLLPPTTLQTELKGKLQDAIDRRNDEEYQAAINEQKMRSEALWNEVEQRLEVFSGRTVGRVASDYRQ